MLLEMCQKLLNQIKMILGIIAVISIAGYLGACDGNLRHSLDMAGDNREELEKVLRHFKDDPDPLKYKAAKFLIENMPYHYSFEGKDMERYDSVYLEMAKYPAQKRDSVLAKLSGELDLSDVRINPDILSVNAEYLIKAINEACEVWYASDWHDQYSEDIFFDYVLPYRLANERISDWHEAIDMEFPYLRSNHIISRRGQYYEAEDSETDITLESPQESEKLIWLRYSSISKDPEISIKVNEKPVGKFRLEPTLSLQSPRDSRIAVPVRLRAGENKLTIKNEKGDVRLDRIMVSAVESIPTASEDFGTSFYRIKNYGTKNYILFDTLKSAELKPVGLAPLSEENDSCYMARLDFKGESCWSISPFRRNTDETCLEVRYCATEEGAPISQYKYQGGNHQKWILIPTGDGSCKIMSKDSGLFLESLIDEEGKEIIVQTGYAGRDTQKWTMERCGTNSQPNPRYPFRSAAGAAMKVHDLMPLFDWLGVGGTTPPKISSLMRGRTGNCLCESCYTVSLCRHIGIPSAIDFTPSYANRSRGHSWSVLINPDGSGMLFHMGFAPGDSVYYVKDYIRPKVFRHRFRLNRDIAQDFKGEKDVPTLFQNADFIDVTEEYCEVTDVTREIPDDVKGDIAYICVFDNKDWVPVDYGKIRNGKVTFHKMGRNVVYSAALFRQGTIVPFGDPFIIDLDGNVKDIKAERTKRQTMTLLRKYPFMSYKDEVNRRLDGGRFEASNDRGFNKVVTLHTHHGLTDGNWYEIKVKNDGEYRFVRYIGADNSYCNINEMEWFSPDGEKIQGEIIGTQGIEGKTKENVFDGDILTGFEGDSPDGHWVGLKFNRPVKLGRIRYIPRNDGNCIEVGDEYELLYWHDNNWKSLGKKKATENQLVYDAVPSGGLYVIRNHTKGKEERIFTYEDGKQVWW